MEPNEQTANADTELPADASAPAPDATIDTAAPVADTQEPASDIDAFAKGVEEARQAEVAGKIDADGAPVLQTGEPAAAPPADPNAPVADAAKPDDKPVLAEPKPEDKPKDVEAEIKELGITNERTQKRFRELTERAAEVEPLRSKAQKAEEWEQTIQSTGTNPEQFGAALEYLRAVNSGSPEAMTQAYAIMQKELQWLGEKLGREAPGFDPLSRHADLQAKVESGDLTREVAAEIAQLRQRGALQQEHVQQQTAAQQAQFVHQQAIQQVGALGEQLRANDPQFQQKFAYLAPTVDLIQKTLPPQQWAAEIQAAYARLPAFVAPAPVAQPARPAASPIRPSGAPIMAAKPKNDIEAFGMGVEIARARGL